MEIWKYLYVCIFAVMAWLMTACVSDEQEGMFSGRGEAVTGRQERMILIRK